MKRQPVHFFWIAFMIVSSLLLFSACSVKSKTADQVNITTKAVNSPVQSIIPTQTHQPKSTAIPSQTSLPEPTATPGQPSVPTQPPTVTALPENSPDPNAKTLRAYAAQRGKLIGAAVNNGLVHEADYAAVLAREFNLLTTENAMKWSLIQPERYRYDWAGADELVNFALAHGMKVRGHTLVWTQQMPDWLKYTSWTRDELIEIMKDHIANVVGRYRGRVYVWDVVNEASVRDGKISTQFWANKLGGDYIDLAFQTAHEADPDALLFYNDYGTEDMGGKSNEVYEMVKNMKDRGIPIDGVGLQFHEELNKLPDLNQVALNIKRLGDIGLQVHITELDIRLPTPPTQEQLAQQAKNYQDILKVCLEAPNCTAFIMWGMTDKYSWVPKQNPGFGSALIFDENYQPKPAYQALLDALMQK